VKPLASLTLLNSIVLPSIVGPVIEAQDLHGDAFGYVTAFQDLVVVIRRLRCVALLSCALNTGVVTVRAVGIAILAFRFREPTGGITLRAVNP